jgi:co-chaperonin GroES (HSP10)
VKPKEVETTTKSGVILAVDEKAERNAQTVGEIISLGEDSFVAYRPKTEFWGLKAGDRIHFPKYAGKWLRDSKTGEEILAINDEDVIAKEED